MIFCGAGPEQIKNGLVVGVGPNVILIPADKLSTRKSVSTRHQISAQSIEVITLNWISPTGVTFQPLENYEQENLTIQFVAPPGMQIDTKSLKIVIFSDSGGCRGGSEYILGSLSA